MLPLHNRYICTDEQPEEAKGDSGEMWAINSVQAPCGVAICHTTDITQQT